MEIWNLGFQGWRKNEGQRENERGSRKGGIQCFVRKWKSIQKHWEQLESRMLCRARLVFNGRKRSICVSKKFCIRSVTKHKRKLRPLELRIEGQPLRTPDITFWPIMIENPSKWGFLIAQFPLVFRDGTRFPKGFAALLLTFMIRCIISPYLIPHLTPSKTRILTKYQKWTYNHLRSWKIKNVRFFISTNFVFPKVLVGFKCSKTTKNPSILLISSPSPSSSRHPFPDIPIFHDNERLVYGWTNNSAELSMRIMLWKLI